LSARPRVAVVGAGASGLSAAERLHRAGAEVVVFEAKPWIGGRTRTDVVDGFRIDTYTQLFGSMHTEVHALLDRLDASHLAIRMPGRDAVWRNGRAHEVVYGSVASMLTTGAVPMATKLRLGTRYLRFLDRHARDLDIHEPERAAAAGLDTESVAEWGERELGADFVEYLAYPLLASATGVAPEQVSAGLYHILASVGSDVEMFALRGGIGRLCELIAERVQGAGGEVRISAEVRRVEHASDGVEVSGDGWTERFDGAVLCVPAPSLPALLPDLSGEARAWIGGVRYQPLASLALMLDESVGVDYFGLSFTRHDAKVVSTVCVEESKDVDLVPDGKGLLVVFPAPAAVQLFLESAPDRVLGEVVPEIARVFPGVRSRIRRAKLYRWPVGGPVFYPGYLAHVGEFRRAGIDGAGRISFGGDYLTTPSAEGSARAGRDAAERLLARLPGAAVPIDVGGGG
jgi:protoporphyrinogen/coproporphyrinogen III oxidase